MGKLYTVPLPTGVQLCRGGQQYRSYITVRGRSTFLHYHNDIDGARAAIAYATEVRDRHIREGLPLTVAQLKNVHPRCLTKAQRPVAESAGRDMGRPEDG